MQMKILKNLKQYLLMFVALTFSGSLVLLSAGCSEIDSGEIVNGIELPTNDSTMNFYCANEGIFEETCVLDNPENPYARVAITADDGIDDPDEPVDPPQDTNDKFFLSDSAPSAKARYYVWATALAKGVGLQGENQYYTAIALQELYAENGSPTTRDQAEYAYRSVLDNYFLSVTYFTGDVDGVETVYAVPLKDLTGQNLHTPVPPLGFLYEDTLFALETMSEWGYIYDETLRKVSIFK